MRITAIRFNACTAGICPKREVRAEISRFR
nr:MAG TPA: hypothetical protein [Caudoviricetes sp.]